MSDIELEVDRFLGRYGEPAPEWQRADLTALLNQLLAERDRRIAELEAAIKPAKELASVFIHVLTGAKLTDEAYALLPRSYDLVKLIGFPDSKP